MARDVKDLVAHLLDGSLRRLSIQRDGQTLDAPEIRSFEDMVAFVQQLNTTWMVAMKRASPRVLMDLLRWADPQVAELFEGLDPERATPFGVAWAGEEWSANWFDIAREYTEKWHHQQQIRDAVGRPGLAERRYLHPVSLPSPGATPGRGKEDRRRAIGSRARRRGVPPARGGGGIRGSLDERRPPP
jgi:hypothetical protein